MDLLTKATEQGILVLVAILQRQEGRTGSPTFYLLRNGLAVVHGAAAYVCASSLDDRFRGLLRDKLDVIRSDQELSSEEEIWNHIEDLSWWLENSDKTLGEREL